MLKSLEPRGFEPLPPHYKPARSVVDPDRTDRVRARCRFEQVLTNRAGVRLKSLLNKASLCSTYNWGRFPETYCLIAPRACIALGTRFFITIFGLEEIVVLFAPFYRPILQIPKDLLVLYPVPNAECD